MQKMIDAWQAFWHWVNTSTPDDFNKVVLALVALIALFLGPLMQWRIARRQIQIQAEIANRQIETQSRIATRQIADNISSKRQNWIDELRKDAAEFLTVVGRIQELKRIIAKAAAMIFGRAFQQRQLVPPLAKADQQGHHRRA